MAVKKTKQGITQTKNTPAKPRGVRSAPGTKAKTGKNPTGG